MEESAPLRQQAPPPTSLASELTTGQRGQNDDLSSVQEGRPAVGANYSATVLATAQAIERVSVACQTEPNLIDKLIDTHQRKQLDDVDLYQEYVRSAECAQFWPLDKNPIRSLVPSMLKVDLPEQHLKNESLMFDLVQAISNNSKLVNLLAKYIHHIVPNVIISKRIDLIPLITCTIRVCHDTSEQERLISLLFNLIKRPNEEQRRMILSGIIVVLQVSPHQNSNLLLPNLWDHVNDKFPERRILLAESCATLAHYVRPVMRTNLILSILIQLLKDKNAAVRSAACKSFACLLSLIMDRNDEVFDACLSATEDIIQDMLAQSPLSFCEHRFELEQMRFCILETIFPLVTMWAVKLNRFKVELAEFYLSKAERYFCNLLNNNTTPTNSNCTHATTSAQTLNGSNAFGNSYSNSNNHNVSMTSNETHHSKAKSDGTASSSVESQTNGDSTCDAGRPPSQFEAAAAATRANAEQKGLLDQTILDSGSRGASLAAAAVAKRRLAFLESRHSASLSLSAATANSSSSSSFANSSGIGSLLDSSSCSVNSNITAAGVVSNASCSSSASGFPAGGLHTLLRRQSAFVGSAFAGSCSTPGGSPTSDSNQASALLSSQRATSAYLKILNYLVPFVFSDAVHSCAWLSKSKLHLPEANGFSSNYSNTASEDSTCHSSCKGGGESSRNFNSSSATVHESSLKWPNKLLEPTLLVDGSAIVAFYDQLEQDHTAESVDWILNKFLHKFLTILASFAHKKFHLAVAGNSSDVLHEYLFTIITSVRQLCHLFGKHLTRTKLRPQIRRFVIDNKVPALFFVYIASLSSFEPIEQQEFEEIVLSVRQNLLMPELTRNDVELLALSIKIIATSNEQIRSPSTRQKFLTYILDALISYSNQIARTNTSHSSSGVTTSERDSVFDRSNPVSALNNLLHSSKIHRNTNNTSNSNNNNTTNNKGHNLNRVPNLAQAKEFMLIIFRHILTCLIDPNIRPTEWAHILVTKFVPLLILLANDSTDVYVCTYARLMCAQLVDTFDNYLSSPKLTQEMAESVMPALSSLKGLTASNLRRHIDCLIKGVNEKF